MTNTKEKILQAAFREFLQKGYREVTLENLVSELNLTKGAFYHYFSSKQSLFEEVVDNYVFSVGATLRESGYDQSLTFVDNLMKVVDRALEEYEAVRRHFNVGPAGLVDMNYYGLMIDAAKHYPGFLNKVAECHKKPEIDLYIRFINHARDREEIRMSVDPMMLALTIQALLDGVGINLFFVSGGGDVRKHIRNSLRFIYELVKS